MALSLRQTRQKDPAEWFLISGDFCIRLIRPVTIGVDANGVLQLNAKEVTGRWLTLEVAPDVNSVAIAWLDASLELRNAEPQQTKKSQWSPSSQLPRQYLNSNRHLNHDQRSNVSNPRSLHYYLYCNGCITSNPDSLKRACGSYSKATKKRHGTRSWLALGGLWPLSALRLSFGSFIYLAHNKGPLLFLCRRIPHSRKRHPPLTNWL